MSDSSAFEPNRETVSESSCLAAGEKAHSPALVASTAGETIVCIIPSSSPKSILGGACIPGRQPHASKKKEQFLVTMVLLLCATVQRRLSAPVKERRGGTVDKSLIVRGVSQSIYLALRTFHDRRILPERSRCDDFRVSRIQALETFLQVRWLRFLKRALLRLVLCTTKYKKQLGCCHVAAKFDVFERFQHNRRI